MAANTRMTGTSAEGEAEDLLELGDRRARLADLDGRHAHRLRRLEVDAEVVEEHALARFHLEQLARPGVELGLWLADADLARLHDDVELGHHRGHLGTVL